MELFVGAVLLTLFVKTTTANADIAAGNQAYAAQDYDAALQRYTAAQAQVPGQPEPAYNAAKPTTGRTCRTKPSRHWSRL